MKKAIFVYPIAIGMVFLLAGCEVNKPAENTGTITNPGTVSEQPKEQEKLPETKTDETAGKLAPFFQTNDVEYRSEPVKLNTDEVLTAYKNDLMKARDEANKEYNISAEPAKWSDIAGNFDFYDVGTLKKAPYENWKLLVMNYKCDGMCESDYLYRFAYNKDQNKVVLLAQNSTEESWGNSDVNFFDKTADKSFSLPGFTLPKVLVLPDGINSVELKGKDVDMFKPENLLRSSTPSPYTYFSLGKVAFTDPKLGDVYFSGNEASGCLFVKLPDGSISQYAFEPRISDQDHYQVITWDDNKVDHQYLTGEYNLLARGCGIGSMCYYIENVKESDLEKKGKTNEGMDIYIVKNPVQIADSDEARKNYNDAQNSLATAFRNYESSFEYMDANTRGKKLSFQEFVDSRAVLYFKDPFGRFVGLLRNDVTPPAECGKPVIYLYPEKTTDVSVKVGISQFTKTVPDYGKGWVVKAEPNGELMNYADGKNYPYLFWEGISDKSVNVTTGFVIAKADLEGFLKDSLSKMGLNEQEKADFIEFWLPKMKDAEKPYVFVSFVGTSEFNKVAPLDISPRPDTLIRVFMYYQPVDREFSVMPQELKSIPRKGFTVVEWGGTSSEAWQVM